MEVYCALGIVRLQTRERLLIKRGKMIFLVSHDTTGILN